MPPLPIAPINWMRERAGASEAGQARVFDEREDQMNTEQSTRIVESIYEEFGRGDVEALVARLHADVVVTMHAPTNIPYAGIRRGPAEVRAWFGEIASAVTFDSMTPETIIASGLQPGETVVTDGHLRLVPGSHISVKGQNADSTRSGD